MDMPPKKQLPASEKSRKPRKAQRSLSDPETLANFTQNLQEGIYITNETGEIIDANPAFLEIFGMSSMEEMQKYRVNDFVDEHIRKSEMALLESKGSLRSRELEITRLDGEIRIVLDSWYGAKDTETGETLFHGILVDITGRKGLETQLREQSVRDPLTGCYNRRLLDDLYRRARPADESWGCIYVDIDHFKQYNDTHGHAAGDSVLLKMSRFLMRYVRAEEPVIRMGGDEFLIVLSEATHESTESVARRLESAGPDTAPASFSLGWAVRGEGEQFEDTVNRADRSMIEVRVERRPEKYTRRRTPSDFNTKKKGRGVQD
jgi:diguanylate cyclase (GGDEF)-like protein/PAS domain S-box-containing protein